MFLLVDEIIEDFLLLVLMPATDMQNANNPLDTSEMTFAAL